MTLNYYHIDRDIEVGKRPRKLVKSAHSGASRTRWSSRNAREGSPVSPRTRTAKRRGRFRSSQREAYTVLKTGEPLRAVQAAIRRGLKRACRRRVASLFVGEESCAPRELPRRKQPGKGRATKRSVTPSALDAGAYSSPCARWEFSNVKRPIFTPPRMWM